MFVEIDNDILLRSEIEKNFKNDVRWKAIYFDLEKLLYTSCPKESPRFVPILTSEGKKIQFWDKNGIEMIEMACSTPSANVFGDLRPIKTIC